MITCHDTAIHTLTIHKHTHRLTQFFFKFFFFNFTIIIFVHSFAYIQSLWFVKTRKLQGFVAANINSWWVLCYMTVSGLYRSHCAYYAFRFPISRVKKIRSVCFDELNVMSFFRKKMPLVIMKMMMMMMKMMMMMMVIGGVFLV